jgi:small GTP-binding protein
MEFSSNTSTHEESSKMKHEEPKIGISRRTFQPNQITNDKENISLKTDVVNETVSIKGTIITYNFKLVLVGNQSVGKSSIIRRYIHHSFNKDYTCTIGTELSKKSLPIGDRKQVNLYIWDTCGQEKFRSVTRQYYHDTQAILFVFDLINRKSFDDMKSWIDEALNYTDCEQCMFFLIGNKSDMKEEICVESKEIKNFLKKSKNLKKYFEVSALENNNIDVTFDKISQYLVTKFSGEEINNNMKELKSKLEIANNNKNSSGCC